MHSPLTIVHTPYGNGSPYVPTLAERVPQDPVGGDMVTLWFLTTPGDPDYLRYTPLDAQRPRPDAHRRPSSGSLRII